MTPQAIRPPCYEWGGECGCRRLSVAASLRHQVPTRNLRSNLYARLERRSSKPFTNVAFRTYARHSLLRPGTITSDDEKLGIQPGTWWWGCIHFLLRRGQRGRKTRTEIQRYLPYSASSGGQRKPSRGTRVESETYGTRLRPQDPSLRLTPS